MTISNLKKFPEIAVTFLLFVNTMFSSGVEKNNSKQLLAPQHASGVPHFSLLNINNCSMWASDDGRLDQNVQAQAAGMTFPRGTATVVYASGFVWGGYVQDGLTPTLRAGGQTYLAGTVPGRIIAPGIVENPNNSDVRIYRIRRDWKTADLRRDAAETFGKAIEDVTNADVAALRTQYQEDWIHWPWQKGAPYYDRDGVQGYQPNPNGDYDSTKDEPGLANADEVLWFVCNDLTSSATTAFAGSPPIGIEEQITCWAYSSSDELNNAVFQRYRLIYKGTATTPAAAHIDSMYIAKWADPDIGNNNNDFVGCNEVHNFGYAYNSTATDDEFSKFGITPSAVGYVLLQGPRVPHPGGTARWNLSTVTNFINLQMTSFGYLASGSNATDPVNSLYRGTSQWWDVFHGLRPQQSGASKCYKDPFSSACSRFPLSGDPRLLQGWVDGRVDKPGDRRMVLVSGPFQMALGDTQEAVIAFVGGIGKDIHDGITRMEQADTVAHDLLTLNFHSPSPVPAPNVRIVELDSKIILDWESDTTKIKEVESYKSRTFTFDSYKIYQFLGPSLSSNYKLYPPFDVSLPRVLTLTDDLFRNRPLVNGQSYFYAVTSVAYNSDPALLRHRIESPVVIQQAIPHSPDPGTIYPYDIGDTVYNVHDFVSFNDAAVRVIYSDPTKADGHAYKVKFRRAAQYYKPYWDFIDSTAEDTLLRNMDVDIPPRQIISRGFSIEVISPLFGLKSVTQTMYKSKPSQENIFASPNSEATYMILSAGASQLQTLFGKNLNDQDVEWRFTGDSSWAVWATNELPGAEWRRVPYTLWQMDRNGGTANRQLYSFVQDFGNDTTWNAGVLLSYYYAGKQLHGFYPVSAVVDSEPSLNILNVYNDSIPWLPDGYITKAFIWAYSKGARERTSFWKAYIADLDEDNQPVPLGTIIRFTRFKDIHDKDEKLITPRATVSNDVAAAKEEIRKINVFPNPYYGLNRAELSRGEKFITFNHLPYRATIRIINLSGVMVKTIQKDDPSQFARWNLNNENGLPIASGIYLAHLDLYDANGIDLGSTMLKLMIVQEERFLLTR